jgi:hypothetical protein
MFRSCSIENFAFQVFQVNRHFSRKKVFGLKSYERS